MTPVSKHIRSTYACPLLASCKDIDDSRTGKERARVGELGVPNVFLFLCIHKRERAHTREHASKSPVNSKGKIKSKSTRPRKCLGFRV
jgi:hypothetical protein